MSFDTSIRINELAKELGMTSKEIIEKLGQLSITGKTHSSTITPDQIKRLKEFISQGSQVVAKKPKAFIVKKAKAPEAEPVQETVKEEAPKKAPEPELPKVEVVKSRPATNRLEIVCSEGKLVLEGGVMKIYSLDFDEEEYRKGSEMSGAHKQPIIEEYSPSEKPEAHVGVLRAFIGKINGECELLADGREGVNQLTISNAAYLSAWTGSEISLPLDKSRFDALLEEKKKGSSYDEKANQSGASADGTMSNRWEIKW